MKLTKLDTAHRQLDCAIKLLFDGADPVAIHTVAGAASNQFSDLVESNCPDKSWDRYAQEDNGLEPNIDMISHPRDNPFFKEKY